MEPNAQPLVPDFKESVDFLRRFLPGGPWTLTAIPENKLEIQAQTFTSAAKLLEWLEERKAHNIYFQVNPLMHAVSKKSAIADVAALSWLHVDVDPSKDADLAAEQARIKKLFTDELPAGIPMPTCVLFSGGGCQGFWRLRDPLPINGQVAAAVHGAAYNRQLELVFGGDHCHNVDRIMRLPGTINWPDERKRSFGRTPALARVLYFSDTSHDLSEFMPAAAVQSREGGLGDYGGGTQLVNVSGNVGRLDSIDDLPEAVKPKTRVLIVQGEDPEDPTAYESRSEVLFRVVCDLVRANVDDDTIYSILTDDRFRISDSVLGKGSGADRYALRQILRAKEASIDPALTEMNDKHAVIGDMGGKCRIISERFDAGLGRTRISFQSFPDFHNRYNHRSVPITTPAGPAEAPMGSWWTKHPLRRQYESIIFAPEREIPGYYNLWRGFAYDALPGRSCDKFLEHVNSNICGGSQELYDYLVDWMAAAVQRPDSPGHTAIVMRGRQGVGKSFFVKTFGALFGRHFLHISDPKHLIGSFNAHLRDCVVLFADEAFYAGDKKHEGVLKMLVTEETLTIEAKGVDVEVSPNCVHLLMASNSDWVVPAGYNERRFLVLDVGDRCMQKREYFKAIQEEMNAGGYEALLHFLRKRNLRDFSVRRVPETAALMEQKVMHYDLEEEWWYAKLQAGEVLSGKGWPLYVFVTELQRDFVVNCAYWRSRRGSVTSLGKFLSKAMPDMQTKRIGGVHRVVNVDGTEEKITRPRIYSLPTLSYCRNIWDLRFGGPYEWPPPEEVVPEDTDTPF